MSHPVAKSAELADQRRFKMDAWCHLVSSLFAPTVNHDFVCCVLSMLQRYFASYFSQIILAKQICWVSFWRKMTHNSGECHGDFFRTFKTSVAFKILALAVSDSLKALIKIAYPGWNIMEKTLEVTVWSVNIGKVINTRRKLLGALHNYTSVACCCKVGIRFLYLPLKIYVAIYK